MELEVGKWYELNNGQVHQCVKPGVVSGDYFYLNGWRYDSGGIFWGGSSDFHLSVKREVDPPDADIKERLFEAYQAGEIELPVRETMTIYGIVGELWEWFACRHPEETHKITFDTINGEPVCESVKMERIK